MASEVDICNIALGYLGDSATVSSLDPPEGSAQAGHCSRFYPITRDALLELHPWNFATKRQTLALLDATPPSAWAYAYALPSDVLKPLAVLDPEAPDDFNQVGSYSPQTFVVETMSDADVLLTNQENAVLRYTALVSDTTKFTPLFVEALAWLLASKLAGPLLKGTTGMDVAKGCLKEFTAWFGQATKADANARRTQTAQSTPWVANR